ncbi:MAG: CDP-glycerol glycerophosphotransferase family protein [Eubacterium sp.]|nr:CDP-glycerol glycerophosphotransferase family protein [Eubacterium sp.]
MRHIYYIDSKQNTTCHDYSADTYNKLLGKTEGFLFVCNETDEYEKIGREEGMRRLIKMTEDSGAVLASGDKKFRNGGKTKKNSRLRFQKSGLPSFPDRLTGTVLNLKRFAEICREKGRILRLNESLIYDMEADFILRLIPYNIFVDHEIVLMSDEPSDIDYKINENVYDKEWYFQNIEEFLIPFFDEFGINEDSLSEHFTAAEDLRKGILVAESGEGIEEEASEEGDEAENNEGSIKPVYELSPEEALIITAEYYALYSVRARLEANKDNRNKHVLNEEDIERYKEDISRLLNRINDEVILRRGNHTMHPAGLYFNRMLMILKGKCEEEYVCIDDNLHLLINGIDFYHSGRMRVNYIFLDRVTGENGECLEIDATVPDAFSRDKAQFFFRVETKNGTRDYPVKWTERYTLTKYFGVSAYKRYAFHASIPLVDINKGKLYFLMRENDREYIIKSEFKSHISRLTLYPKASYWHTGRFLCRAKKEFIKLDKYNFFKMAGLEILIWLQLLKTFKKHKIKFMLLRMGYVFTRPVFKRKHIWMYFDKIYKGGDSSEYLYKYAERAKGDRKISNYYLLDKNVPDYKRLLSEGYKPLARKSIKHRLAFLNAEMMIVSNSTVFAFNDYYLENSRYIRGITDFHVVCVQHGLSVQKIAVAQNRLRDNTRLYFCASRYEIENLMRPVYDYQDYNALKLTGVPRYDGLKDNDKKQILISPTWRMQSAKPVSKNEGVERDYNEDFKNSDYFKVYNSLINDSRLIEAAAKYGYSIKYVLHPIVSPQAKDFDTNPYVEIIPSTGEMSYEKLFCESSLMVTDFSGVQFDFAYMRKPLIYLHHNDLDAHYEEGSYRYDTMAFGEIVHTNDELIELITEYMKDGCGMKEMYRKRADDFFCYSDHDNCRRIYAELIKYYDDVVH